MGYKLLDFVSFQILNHDKYHFPSRSRSALRLRIQLRPMMRLLAAPAPQHLYVHKGTYMMRIQSG
jgi:hypothetical protein